MSPEIIRSLIMILGPAGLAWAVWVTMSHMKARNELDALRLHISEHYAKNDALKAIDDKLDRISAMVNRIEGQLASTSPKV